TTVFVLLSVLLSFSFIEEVKAAINSYVDLFDGVSSSYGTHIFPATGVVGPESYAWKQVGNNIGSAFSTGYIEALVYNPQFSGSNDSYGSLFLFELNDIGSNGRRFTVYLDDGFFQLDAYDSTGTRRIIRHSNSTPLS